MVGDTEAWRVWVGSEGSFPLQIKILFRIVLSHLSNTFRTHVLQIATLVSN